MRRTMLKSLIRRATITEASVNVEGSLTIDPDLLDAAGMLPYEQIHVWDATNGARIVTFTLPGERGSGDVRLTGGGAHLIHQGDQVVIATFTQLRRKEARKHEPIVVVVDEFNRPMMAVPAAQAPVTTPMGAAPRKKKKKET